MINKLYVKVKNFCKENKKALIGILLLFLLFHVELPYVVEIPGGFIKTSSRIEVEDGYTESGSFGLAYVSMLKGNIPDLLIGLLNKDWDIVKKEDVKYDEETYKESLERGKIEMNEAISNAIYNAYTYAGKPITVKSEAITITYLDSTDTELKLFDVIKKVEGEEIHSVLDIRNIIENKEVDSYVTLEIERDGKLENVRTKVMDVSGYKRIGVATSIIYDLEETPSVEVSMKSSESGPSGGLMMSLEIYNQLTENDLTKGRKIIGTGTIDKEGNVGEIGGVKYKLMGAVKKGAEIFICPKENLSEAESIKNEKGYSIKIIGVETFKEAVEKLNEE